MKELREIAGFFVGDGFWLDGKAAFSNTNDDSIRYYGKIITQLGFKISLYRRKKKGNRKDEFTLVAEKRFTEPLIHDLENMWIDLDNEKSKSFLRGFFDAEGCVSFSSTRRGRSVEITNTDIDLINLSQVCLKKLDISSKITLLRGFRPNRKKCFRLKTYGKDSVKFLRLVKSYKISSENYLDGKVHPKYLPLFR